MNEDDQTMKRTRRYVEHAFRQIQQKPNVMDVIVINSSGNPIKSTMDDEKSLQHAGQFELLTQKAKYVVQNLNAQDEILCLRVRTKFHEALVTPDGKITFLVIQNPTDQFQKEIIR